MAMRPATREWLSQIVAGAAVPTDAEKCELLKILDEAAEAEPEPQRPQARLRFVLDNLEEITTRVRTGCQVCAQQDDGEALLGALEEAHDLLLYIRGGGDPRAIDVVIG